MISNALLEKHLKTHSERADEDRAAVAVLKSFLRADGKIAENIQCNDTWPNIDGTIEHIINPDISRKPNQVFSVQVKGTSNYSDSNGKIKYILQSLAFPSYILKEVTADPGILFVVLNPKDRDKERVFWKYMSIDFLTSINYNNNSYTIIFDKEDEIKNTAESINEFCSKLYEISFRHSFVKKLETIPYTLADIKKIVTRCSIDIEESIDRIEKCNDTRDNVSQRILSRLEDLCKAALLMNVLKNGEENASLQLAWEKALFDRKARYLSSFLKMLKYLACRVPDDGQSERLMLKYYDFMWQIREEFKKEGIKILYNLEKFPLEENTVDKSYYDIVAKAIEAHSIKGTALKNTKYYIEKENPFYVNGKRYFEITLQLAGVYATKFNRLTVYTKEFIPSSYSIQIGYDDLDINLWDVDTKIKYITSWKVAIEPICLNKLAKILKIKMRISANYGEYDALMKFLTETGINLLEFIDCKEIDFENKLNDIYLNTNTEQYKQVLLRLRNDFNVSSPRVNGYNTIRYLIIKMREESFEAALKSAYSQSLQSDQVYLSSKCFPFEKRPLISNFVGSKTNNYAITKDVIRAVGYDQVPDMLPYLIIKNKIDETGEIYFNEDILGQEDAKIKINKYNSVLDSWEKKNGYLLKCDQGLVCIESFERDTLYIIKNLLQFSESGNKGQEAVNRNYLKNHENQIEDNLKKQALSKVFVSSKVMLIYGAAGTGKTTLMNYISELMTGRKKLFLTKTHTALQNLKRSINKAGADAHFLSIDSFIKKNTFQEYDIIFLDECSTIDNKTMSKFFEKISDNILLVLAGDIYQLEAIDFGNWFSYAKELISDNSKIELLNTWRTHESKLKELWNEVRTRGDLIREKLAMDGPYSEEIDKNLLQKIDKDDEVVLCLNYDGKFGLNNINTLFQANNNQSKPYTWQEWSYKVGDPILFTESKRFANIFYNNLKGKIVNIYKINGSITFTIDINMLLTESDFRDEEIEYIDTFDNSTRIKFTVYEDDGGGTDEERAISRMKSVVPFHLAYAVSIHKAQGLEYNSVKIIIPDNNSERITHGVFYTAITRAKHNLKIYWSPETMDKILKNFVSDERAKTSLEIIKNKLF